MGHPVNSSDQRTRKRPLDLVKARRGTAEHHKTLRNFQLVKREFRAYGRRDAAVVVKGSRRDMNKWSEVLRDPNIQFLGE